MLSRLTHHNPSTRLNSLNGIRELITNNPQILGGPSLRNTILKILELLIDIEHKVRKTAINLLNEILSQLPTHYIIPFYDILNVHVSCAMTHREISIQQDSLKFIGIVIEQAPDALKRNFPVLVQNFLRIISGSKFGQHVEIASSKKFKQDIVKSKIESLTKFYELLNAVYSNRKTIDENVNKIIEIKSQENRFDIKSLNTMYKTIPDISSLFKRSKTDNFTSLEEHYNEYQSLVSGIMPLMFDTWTEFGPSEKKDNFTMECLLTESSAQLLYIILQIILLLYEKTTEQNDAQLVRS